MGPLVSIVVPIFNVEPYLRDCVDSLISQTYRNIEVILVDDGSTDGCPTICDEYAGAYRFVSVIHKLNGGLSDARNCGLEKARGEFITFVDSDDWIAPGMIERCLDLIQKFSADVCGVSFMKAYPDGRLEQNETAIREPECYERVSALSRYLFNSNLTVCVCGKLWRKRLWDEVRCPKGLLHEDQHTTYRLIDNADYVVFDPEPLYYYRQREGSIGHSSFSARSYDLLDGIDVQYEYISKKYPEIKGEISAACSFWYCVFTNMMLRAKYRDPIAQKRCQSFVRQHLNAIFQTPNLSNTRVAQLCLFALNMRLYSKVYLLFIVRRGRR